MLLFYTKEISPRLNYIVDFFSQELFDEPIRITTDADYFRHYPGPRLNYSGKDFSESEFYLQAHPLLFQSDIRAQEINLLEVNLHKAFFACKGDFPFDVFAASFYLLSRYEEYLPHEKDSYGRFAHTGSLAFREGFLNQPLINCWLEQFKHALQQKFPELAFRHQQFNCLISYDIDIAYSYRCKGWQRNAGGLFRDLLQGKGAAFRERLQVLTGKTRDPYDCFEWLDALHLYCRVKPLFFFLVARKSSRYDKNSSPRARAFQELIEYYGTHYHVGIHPSWQSGDQHELLKEEKEWLEVICDQQIENSRQHYIRFTLPQDYRRLIEAGIRNDYSMGYGSINGFRASVCTAFFWYDLEKNCSTSLKLFPFCYMDANSLFEQKHSPTQAYEELIGYYQLIKKYRGSFIGIWHNHLLCEATELKGWRQMFEVFMRETVYWDAYSGE